jgi:putative NIF3 family GTP cyclohydrolase 1 type 2
MCAGSGGPIVLPCPADVIFTGELSHHDALSAIEHGRIVIATFHSNSERGFLKEVMQPKLLESLREAWAEVRRDGGAEETEGREVEVGVSEVDCDPYVVVRVPRKGEKSLSM